MGVLWDRVKGLLGSCWCVLRAFRWGYGAFSSMLIGRCVYGFVSLAGVYGFVSLAAVLQRFVEVALHVESV